MGFGALVSLVAQRPGLGLRIVGIRILKCSGTGFDETFTSDNLETIYKYFFF